MTALGSQKLRSVRGPAAPPRRGHRGGSRPAATPPLSLASTSSTSEPSDPPIEYPSHGVERGLLVSHHLVSRRCVSARVPQVFGYVRRRNQSLHLYSSAEGWGFLDATGYSKNLFLTTVGPSLLQSSLNVFSRHDFHKVCK